MLKIGVMVSGGGTNLQAIINKINSGYLKNCEIVTVVSSNDNAYALERASQNNIPTAVISKKSYSSIEEYDSAMLGHMKNYGVELIVLAGFLSMLGGNLIKEYKNSIINIHPSLIPAFCGKGYYGIIPHQKAIDYGVKVTGATVHFVEPEYDSGPVILQKSVEIFDDDTPEVLQKRVMEQVEWDILPKAIKLYNEGKLIVEGRRVKIKK